MGNKVCGWRFAYVLILPLRWKLLTTPSKVKILYWPHQGLNTYYVTYLPCRKLLIYCLELAESTNASIIDQIINMSLSHLTELRSVIKIDSFAIVGEFDSTPSTNSSFAWICVFSVEIVFT